MYDIFGGTTQRQTMFGGGSTQDVLSGVYNTPNRELAGSNQGRWLSPDPIGAAWNQYAYVTNPNSQIDPSGLQCVAQRPCPAGFDGNGADYQMTGCLGVCGYDGSFDPFSATFYGPTTGSVVYGQEVNGGPRGPDGNGSYPGEVDCTQSPGCVVWNPNAMGGAGAWDFPGAVDVYPPFAQGVFQGNQQLWNNANGTMKAVTAVYAAGFAVVGGGAVAGGLPTMEIAVGAGEPFHVAYGVGGVWLNAVGETLGDMTVSAYMASQTATTAWFTVSIPILNEAAVMATEGCSAYSCVTAAFSAVGKGWIP